MSHALSQSFSVQTMDQQLYCIAKLCGIYQMNLTTTLCDLVAFIDSGVYASVTVDQMLSGKQYKRVVCGLILMYEAIMRCYTRSFFQWRDTDDHMDGL